MMAQTDTEKNVAQPPRHHHASRDVVILVTAAAGAKLGASVASTITNIKILQEQHQAGTLKENIGQPIWNAMCKAAKLENPEPKKLFNQLKPYLGESTKSALIGAALFAVPAAIIGWKRGNRIENPWDIVHHPLDSFHRLAMSEKMYDHTYAHPHDTVPHTALAQHDPIMHDARIENESLRQLGK